MSKLICFRPQKRLSIDESDAEERRTSEEKKNGQTGSPMVLLQGPVDEGLAITYVTPRIIVVTSPLSGTDSAYRSSLNALARHLKTKHALDYRVWNVGRQRGDLERGVGKENLIEVGWPCHLAPPLDRLCAVSKSFEQWLSGAPSRVIIIHSKGDPQRAAVLVSAFMHYNVICANDDSIEERFSMQRYIERHLGATAGSPSNKRYLNYFTSLLSGKTRVNAAPVYLKKFSIARMPGRVITFKIYERLQPVYLSVPIKTTDPSSIEVGEELRLRGDVLVKCFEDRDGKRRLLFSCQFNTCVFPRPPPLLAFFRDQLDGVFNDTSIDSQAQIDFSFGEQPAAKENGPDSSAAAPAVMRTSSYEDFGTLEDGESVVEYSEILKPSSAGGAASEDSGISVEDSKISLNLSTRSVASPRLASCPQEAAASSNQPPPLLPRADTNGSVNGMGPPVPPKPRPASAMAEVAPDYEMPERRGILPASVKPLVARPPSPKEQPRVNSVTPSIEPDLVGKDRYDKASKCFSYAPTKDLKQAFDRPRKKSFSLASEDEVLAVRPEEVNSVPVRSTDIERMPEEPKWTDEVDRRQAAEEDRWRRELANRPVPPMRSHSSIGDSYSRRRYGGGQETGEMEERPQVVDQGRKISSGSGFGSMRRKPKYGSYRTLNDDYNSDMDDLCDPDFYLNFTDSAKQHQQPVRSQSTVPYGAKSAELPRKQFGRARNDEPLDDLLSYNQSSVARPMPASSLLDLNDDGRDTYRQRNCRSVSHAPPKQDRKLFAERYDALADAAPTEDWLDTKLKKLRSKRGNDPELVQRKKQERMLLEELKNAHDDREAARGKRELDYSVEGVGSRQEPMDPLADYRREEERLRNTNSPFDLDASRRTPKPLRSKPPTPPPRERSRSPTSRINTPSVDHASNGCYGTYGGAAGYGNGARSAPSDYGRPSEYGNSRQQQQQQQQQSAAPVSNGYGYRGHEDEEEYDGEFSTLRSIMQPQQHSRPDSRPILKQGTPSRTGYNTLDFSHRSHTPTHFLSGQERVANAILRAETPTQQFNQYFPAHTLERAETPSYASATLPAQHSQQQQYHHQQQQQEQPHQLQHHHQAHQQPPQQRPEQYNNNDWSQASAGYTDRSETPAFPLSMRETPLPFHPLLYASQNNLTGNGGPPGYSQTLNYRSASPRSQYYGGGGGTNMSRRSSMNSIDQTDVVNHHPIFVKDTSKYWYKPNISREQAISILRDKQPGTFVIRDSNSFPGAFGLALKVATPPPGVAPGDGTELVRHFLIEPSPKGVKLKGCNNEPVFGTLSALVYQHSMTPLALPCKLLLPEFDPATTAESISATQALLEQGAACNVTYVGSVDCESLTGAECVRRSVQRILEDLSRGEAMPVSAHFKVSSQGVTLTDNTRKSFFRRHYPVNSVIFAGIDPAERRFDNSRVVGYSHGAVESARLFAFVARKFDRAENACHIFAEFESEQPASAVVNFINKVMLAQRRRE